VSGALACFYKDGTILATDGTILNENTLTPVDKYSWAPSFRYNQKARAEIFVEDYIITCESDYHKIYHINTATKTITLYQTLNNNIAGATIYRQTAEYPIIRGLTAVMAVENVNTAIKKITCEATQYVQSLKYKNTLLMNTDQGTIYSDNVLMGKTAFSKGNKIVGTMPNNGELNYTPSTETQAIPAGYTSGGSILAVNTPKITNASYLFYNGVRFECKDELLKMLESVTDMQYMFYRVHANSTTADVKILDLSGIDTSNVTKMNHMCYGMGNTEKIIVTGFNTNKVTTFEQMFAEDTSIKEIVGLEDFNTSNCENFRVMFYMLWNMTDLNLSSFDLSKATNVNNMLGMCNKLVNLKSFKNLGKGYTQKSSNYSNYTMDLSGAYNLSHESLMDIIENGLYDLNLTYDTANGGTLYTQKLQLGSSNMARLTAEEIAIATNKGWTVS